MLSPQSAGHAILVKEPLQGRQMWRLESPTQAVDNAVTEIINSRLDGRRQPARQQKGSLYFDQKAIGNYIAGEQMQCFPAEGAEKKASLVSELLGIHDPAEINTIKSTNPRLVEIAKQEEEGKDDDDEGIKAHELLELLAEEEANKKRLITKIVSGKGDTRAIALAWSEGHTSIGTATIQWANHGNGPQYWINEVCKSGSHPGSPSPIPSVLQDCEDFIRKEGKQSAWLMVESQPLRGFGAVLNRYYAGKGYIIRYKDGKYTIMEKPLGDSNITATDAEQKIQGEINMLYTEAKNKCDSLGISIKDVKISQIPTIQKKYEQVIVKLPPIPSVQAMAVVVESEAKKREAEPEAADAPDAALPALKKRKKEVRRSPRLQGTKKRGGRRTRKKRKKRRKTRRRRKKRTRRKKTRRSRR